MCQWRLPLCSGPAYCNYSLLSLQLHNALVIPLFEMLIHFLPLVFFKSVNTSGGPRPGCCRWRSVHLCGCCVQDSFVGPGMHSLAVKSTAWLWLIVLCWVSIQPVSHILTKKKKKPALFWPDYPNKWARWHTAAACSSETGQAMTSHETWLSQVFISKGCCLQRVTSWQIHHDCRHKWAYWNVIHTGLDICPGSTVQSQIVSCH